MTRKSFIQSLLAIPAIVSIGCKVQKPVVHQLRKEPWKMNFATSKDGKIMTKVLPGTKEYDKMMSEFFHN